MERNRDRLKRKIYWKKVKKILDFFLLFIYNYCINKIEKKLMKGDNNEETRINSDGVL